MKKDKVLYLIGLISVLVGLVCAVGAVLFGLLDFPVLSDTLFIISSILGVISLVVFCVRLSNQTKNFGVSSDNSTKVVVKVVDVKEIKKSQEEKLYEQYEDLYKKNLITKEDLDKKKEELLGKK